MKGMLKDAAILFAITLISGLILGAVYQLTKEPIAAQEEKAKTKARQEVFADAVSFADTADFDPEAAQAVLDAGGFSGCGHRRVRPCAGRRRKRPGLGAHRDGP